MPPLTPVPFPLLTGEDTGAVVYRGEGPNRVENGIFTGTGALEQTPDWRLGPACTDGALENDAVCGGGPFQTQGGAVGATGGVAVSFDTSANKLWLHQLGEGEPPTIQRTFDTGYVYTETAPPQITGFEFFGKYLVCPDGREAAAARRGLGIFDPTGAGGFTIASVDVVAGGVGAAPLRFSAIARHLGGTVIGANYLSEEAGQVDAPGWLRGSRYGATDMDADATWQEDNLDTGPWAVQIGTPGLPIVAMAGAGRSTIIGKSSEIFALTGNYKAQLAGDQPIGFAGPLSTTGMVSTGPMAVWMSAQGPAASVNGGIVALLGIDRIRRRLLTYFDLSYTSAVHDVTRTRVGFLLRRIRNLNGQPVSHFWPDQIWWWDYQRDQFTTQGVPTTLFSLFVTDGPGLSLAGPSGVPANLAAAPSHTGAVVSWDHSVGDATAATIVEYRVDGTSPWASAGTTAVGATGWTLTGLTEDTDYNWRLRYTKNGQESANVAGPDFTTLDAGDVAAPTGFTGQITSTYVFGSKTYAIATLEWTQGTTAVGALTDVFESASPSFAAAYSIGASGCSTTSATTQKLADETVYYYWLRDRLADGTVGVEVGPVTIVYGAA